MLISSYGLNLLKKISSRAVSMCCALCAILWRTPPLLVAAMLLSLRALVELARGWITAADRICGGPKLCGVAKTRNPKRVSRHFRHARREKKSHQSPVLKTSSRNTKSETENPSSTHDLRSGRRIHVQIDRKWQKSDDSELKSSEKARPT